MWWGLGAPLDILEEEDKPELNVLLISQTDCRHVLRTVARRYRHLKCKHIKFYIYEPKLENVARSLLFVTLALDSQLGLGAKAQHFMELYGNTLIRQTTWQYLQEATTRLIKIVTNSTFAQNILASVSLDSLKYKERDQLENILKFWNSPNAEFDVINYWDERSRSLLGTRYDSRSGVFDWDLHMRFRPYGGETVSVPEYQRFREKGVSFLQDDSDPCIANTTLATFQPGCTSVVPGYLGDIVTGPYPVFGIDCEEKDMLKKVNGHMWKNATEITEYNVQQLFHEIANGTQFQNFKDVGNQCPILKKDDPQKLITRKPAWRRLAFGDSYSTLPTPGTEIIFLPITALKDYPNRQQFREFFDLITVPHNLVNQLPSNLPVLCKPSCKILVESARFVLHYRKDDLIKQKTAIDDVMKDFGFENIGTYDEKFDDFIKYDFVT